MGLTDWDYLEQEDLADSVKQVADLIGFEDTVALMKVLPIKGVYIPKNLPESHIIRETIGSDKSQKLTKFYSKETLALPKEAALTKAKLRRIKLEAKENLENAESKSTYYAQVANREGLCISRVRGIIHSY